MLRPDVEIRVSFLCLGGNDFIKESEWTEAEIDSKMKEIMEDYDRTRAIERVI